MRVSPRFRLLLLLILVASPLGTGGLAQTTPVVRKDTVEGIANYSRVGDTLGCAGAVTTPAVAAIKAQGYKSIVNLRLASEPGAEIEQQRAAATDGGLRYHHLPFSGSAPDRTVVDRFLAIVADPANSPMFLHCASANRASAFWLVKRVKQDGWPVEQAVEEAAALGLTNPALKQFALDYLAGAK